MGVETHRPFDCHITVSDVAPGYGSCVEKRGRGWVDVVGAHGMELGVEADDDISCGCLGVFMAWEV